MVQEDASCKLGSKTEGKSCHGEVLGFFLVLLFFCLQGEEINEQKNALGLSKEGLGECYI